MRRNRSTLLITLAIIGAAVVGSTAIPAGAAMAATQSQATPAAKTAPGMPKFGEKGQHVTMVQMAIIKNGFTLRGGVTGVFDKRTLAVLKTFQKVVGLPVTGVVDAATAKVLKLGIAATTTTAAPATTTIAPTTTVAPTTTTAAAFPFTIATLPVRGNKGDAVALVQKSLVAAGFQVKGGVDGAFGSGTTATIVAFQTARGLKATGLLDTDTARALGLISPAEAVSAAEASIAKVFPVQGPCNFVDTWHAPRGNGRLHLGVDIIAPEGNLVYATVDGTITKIYTAGVDKLAGNGFRIAMADGTYFFYGHLRELAAGITVGSVVKAGQVLGTVGKTGDTNTPHLHFEVHPKGLDAVNAYPMTKAIDACKVTTPLPAP